MRRVYPEWGFHIHLLWIHLFFCPSGNYFLNIREDLLSPTCSFAEEELTLWYGY